MFVHDNGIVLVYPRNVALQTMCDKSIKSVPARKGCRKESMYNIIKIVKYSVT
jgi:hypothetical protein